MKLETFFEKFEIFADAPDAVAKLRELTLNLAVTGRLSEQRAGDAPVNELLDSLSAAKTRRAKNGRRNNAREVAVESVIGPPVRAPTHWAWVPLNQIGAMSGGMTPSKNKSAFWDGDLSWFSSKDIKTDELTESGLKVTREATEATGLRVYSPGSLVMVARSGILKRTFPVSILRVEATVNQDLKVLSPFVAGLERYLQIMLRGMTDFILAHLVKTGMTVQSLKYQEFEAQPFPLPPLAEQKRIVAKVDELMALCDRLEAQQQERETRHAALARASLARFADVPTPSNLQFLFHPSYSISPDDLRKSILTLAVQGKLVPQDPNEESAEELLKRIAQERKTLLKAAYPNQKEASTQLRKQAAQTLPDELTPPAPGWVWATLMQASLLIVDCHNKTAPYVENGIRLLRTTNIRDGRLNLAEPKFVDAATYERWSARCEPEAGDLLITREAPMGEVCILPEGLQVCLGQRMMLIRVVPGTIDTKYLLFSLMAPDLMDRVQNKPVGATVKHLRVGGVETLLTPIPPFPEQCRIAAKVGRLMTLVDELEPQLNAANADGAELLEALVAELTAAPA